MTTNKFLFVFSLAILLSVPSFAEIFTEDFLSKHYKDASASTASWGFSGIATLTITSAGGLSPVWTSSISYPARRVIMRDNYAYMVRSDSGLQVFNVSNPANVTECGTAAVGSGAFECVIKDTYIYIATWASNISVYDISNPQSPVYVKVLAPGDYPHGMGIDGDYLATTNYNPNPSQLFIYDLRNTTAPVSTSSAISRYANNLTFVNNMIYITSSNAGDSFVIIDATNKTAPVMRYAVSFGKMEHNAFFRNYLFVACDADTYLRCFDVTDPSNPVQTSYLRGAGSGAITRTVRTWANYAFLAGTALYVADISDTTQMISVCTTAYSVSGGDMDIYNGYAFATPGNGFPKMYKIVFNNSGILQSKKIAETPSLIAGATLTASETIPTNTSVDYYLSADDGAHWEGPVARGVRWSFSNTGTSLKWKAVMSTSDTGFTPQVNNVSILYVYDIENPTWNGAITMKTYLDKFDTTVYTAVLSWEPVGDSSVIVYHIDKKSSDSDWTLFDTTLAYSDTVPNLSNSNKYTFRIKAVDAVGNTGEWHEVNDEIAPDWTPDFRIKETGYTTDGNGLKYSIYLSWEEAKDNTGDVNYYEIESKLGTTTWEKATFTYLTGFSFKDIDGNVINKIRIRSRDVASNFTDWKEISLSRLSSTEIGENGGTLSLDDFDGNTGNDASVEVPKDALKKKIAIRIYRLPDDEYEIKTFDASTNAEIRNPVFNKPVTISIPYVKASVIAKGWKEEDLGIYYYDNVKWIPIGGVVDKNNSVVRAKVFHFTVFKVGRVRNTAQNVFQVSIDPSVITPNGDGINDDARFNLVLGDDLLGRDGAIVIYDSTGKIIRGINTQQATSIVWDGRDDNSKLAESGLYVYRISIGGSSVTGTVTVVR